MTLEEKLAQLVGFWVDEGGEARRAAWRASMVHVDQARGVRPRTGSATSPGRTAPARSIPSSARRGCGRTSGGCVTETRLGIPAIVHEECLTGLVGVEGGDLPDSARLGRVVRPRRWWSEMGAADRRLDARARHPPGARARAGRDPRSALGPGRRVHRRGPVRRRHDRHRVRAGAAGAGVHATLKHFVGYSASQAGRNHAPVHAGPARAARRAAAARSRWRCATAGRARS